jgi:hypothetical protein
MKLKLNTDLCAIIIPDTYGSGFQSEVAAYMWEDFKTLMVDKAKEKIEEVLDELGIPYRNLKMGGFWSPREYNFSTDWIEFELDVPDDYVETIRQNVQRDEDNFFRFAKENFGTHDGFISFYPYEKEDFYNVNRKEEYIVSMWIMYRMNEEFDIHAYRYEYLDDVWDYACGNGYTIESEDEYE